MKARSLIIAAGAAWAICATADTFTGTLLLIPNWEHVKTIGQSTAKETFGNLIQWTHTTGTSTNQMNVLVRESTTLTNSETRTLNLRGGVSDSFGDVTTLSTIRFLCIQTPATNGHNVIVGCASNEHFWAWAGDTNQTVTVRPGGTLMLLAPDATGYVVTNGGHNLAIRNAGISNVVYDLYIGGSE